MRFFGGGRNLFSLKNLNKNHNFKTFNRLLNPNGFFEMSYNPTGYTLETIWLKPIRSFPNPIL
jgi:uncharacterized lipoprotein